MTWALLVLAAGGWGAFFWHVRKTGSEAAAFRAGQRELGKLERRVQQLTDDNTALTRANEGLKATETVAANRIGQLKEENDALRRRLPDDDAALLGRLDRGVRG